MAQKQTFLDLPTEVLLDELLPIIPTSDLVRLGQCCKHLSVLCDDDMLWKHKLREEYNFSGEGTARTSGWKLIYQGLFNPRVFVWGDQTRGRLGRRDLPPTSAINGGVPFPIEVKVPSAHIVSLVAGGMSMHALDSRGNVWVWGTLNGTWTAGMTKGFSEAGKTAHSPLKLELPNPVRGISCGRLHASFLDREHRIWTAVNWGHPFWFSSSVLRDPGNKPLQVECGWAFSAFLTRTGEVYVWWPFNGSLEEEIERKMSELDADPANKALATDDATIPCVPWHTDHTPYRLPPIPALPSLPSMENSDEGHVQIVQIAALDCVVVALTNEGHVLTFKSLADEAHAQLGRWEYLPQFSEVEKLRALPEFSGEDGEPAKVECPSTMQITHISANFRAFVAYSTGSSSIVLLGDMDTNAISPPKVIPELQHRSVISVVIGDYHNAALTAQGKLLTWGKFSNGALGLGDPSVLPAGTAGAYAQQGQRGVPPEVSVPTEVDFNRNVKKPRRRFCFSAAAAGWHTGALVIDLDPTQEGDDEELHTPPTPQPPAALRPGRGRYETPGIFRIGFPGRGRGWGGDATM